MMKIATYNVNSVNARLENLLEWLQKEQPDVALLQEIKCEFNAFPFFELQTSGYEAKILGQKSYNGVAVLSRHKIKVIQEGLVSVNGEKETRRGKKLHSGDIVSYNGKELQIG